MAMDSAEKKVDFYAFTTVLTPILATWRPVTGLRYPADNMRQNGAILGDGQRALVALLKVFNFTGEDAVTP